MSSAFGSCSDGASRSSPLGCECVGSPSLQVCGRCVAAALGLGRAAGSLKLSPSHAPPPPSGDSEGHSSLCCDHQPCARLSSAKKAPELRGLPSVQLRHSQLCQTPRGTWLYGSRPKPSCFLLRRGGDPANSLSVPGRRAQRGQMPWCLCRLLRAQGFLP